MKGFTNMEWLIGKWELVVNAILVFMMPLGHYVFALFWIVGMDAITRIACVIKKDGWQGVRSSKLFHTFAKFFIYCCGLVAAHALETILQAVPAMQIAAFTIGVIEFKSVSENVEEYAGVNLFDAIKRYIGSRGKKEEPEKQ